MPGPPPPGSLSDALDPARDALFFDVDGTLLELKPRPELVRADPDLIAILEHLRVCASGAVALVSGRALDDLDRIFAPMTLPAAALHGASIRFPDGSRRAVDAKIMDHARPAAQRFVADHPGLFLEDKGATLAVHFRQRPDLAADVLRFLSEFSPSDEIAVQEGKLVCELKPALFDKGTAIASLLRTPPFMGRRPVFLGDDLTDEAGFARVNTLGGLSIRIGASETPTEARLHVPDPAHLRTTLRELADRREVAP